MSPWVLLAVGLTVATVTGGAYLQGRKDGSNACEATQAREERIGQLAADAAASSAATAISKIEVQHVTVNRKLEREVRTVVDYSRCRHSPDGLRALNEALTGRAEPAGAGVVPAASSPAR